MRESKRAVWAVLRDFGPMTDTRMLEAYAERYDERLGSPKAIPKQSESGLRTRRSELVDDGWASAEGKDVLESGRGSIKWRANQQQVPVEERPTPKAKGAKEAKEAKPDWWPGQQKATPKQRGFLLDGIPTAICAYPDRHEPHFWHDPHSQNGVRWVCGVCHPPAPGRVVVYREGPHAASVAAMAAVKQQHTS